MIHSHADRFLPRIARSSFRRKLSFIYTGLIGALCLGLFIQFPQRVRRHTLNETAQKAHSIAAITSYTVGPAVLFQDSVGIAEVIAATRQGGDVSYVVVRDGNGDLVGSWQLATALRAGYKRARQAPVPKGLGIYRVHETVVDTQGRHIGDVYVGVSLARLDAELASARRWITLVSLLLMIGGMLTVYVISRWVTKPLADMVRVAERVAGGDLTARVETTSEDEVRTLAASFNVMVERLAAAHEELVDANQQLEARVQERTAQLVREVRVRRKAESSARQSENRFRAMFDSAALGVGLFDLDGTLIECNRCLASLAGIELGTAPLPEYEALIHAAERTAVRMHFTEITSGASPSVQFEATLDGQRAGGTAVHVVLSAVSDAKGPLYVIAMMEDVSAQKRLEEMYRQSQKLEAVGRLAGGIAHDFNNLLTTINGTSDLLLSDIPVASPYHNDVAQILDAGRRAASLTRQLLAFSRKQVLRPALIDVSSVVADMKELTTRLVGENIRVTIKAEAGLPPVRADKTQVDQVVMNLVVNAKDAMPHGGNLLIETRRIHLNPRLAELYGATTGSYVEIVVRDSGVGMDEEVRHRLFEPFFTTKELGKGTGLGLATVYGIVKQSDGGILVESSKGKGTTFHVALPAQTADASLPTDANEPSSRGGHGTVLVVEDEETVRNLFVRVLKKAGYHVLEARHGLEALMVSDDYPDQIEMVISDVIMPGMNGPDAVKRLIDARPDIKVLYISGYTHDVMLQHGLSDRHANFLQKPVSPAALTTAVRNILDAREHIAREIAAAS